MFGMGMPELIIILVIALIVIGPKKLPDLARALGKGMSEFKKATQEIKENLNIEEDLKGAKKDLIDSVSGLDKPEEPAYPRSSEEKKAAYQDFDEMLEDYDSMKEEKKKEETAPTEASSEPAPKALSETNRHDG